MSFSGLSVLAGSARKELSAQSQNLFLWLPVFFGAGIAFYFSLDHEPGYGAALFILAVSLATVIYIRYGQKYNSMARLVSILAVASGLAAAGFANARLHTSAMDFPRIEKKTGTTEIEGRVVSLGKLPGKGSHVLLKNLKIEDLKSEHTPRTVRLKIFKDEELKIGQRISVLGMINPPSAPVYPGGFDFRRHAFFKGLGGYGFAYTKPRIIEEAKPESLTDHFWITITHFRQHVQETIYENVHEDTAAVLTALLTGIRSGIAEDTETALRASGLAHLLAISGLHIGLVTGALFFFSRFAMACFPGFALRFPIKKFAALIALGGAAAYTIFVGAPVPTQRALLMAAVVLIAVMIDRSPFSLRLVALAAMTILIVAPYNILSLSFQLSFAAVTGLVAFYEAFRPYIRRAGTTSSIWQKTLFYFGGIALTSVIATLATAPLTLYYFQKMAVYSIFGNIAALPVMAFLVMPFSIVFFASFLAGLESLPLAIMAFGVDLILKVAFAVSDWPAAQLYLPSLPPFALLSMVLGGIILCLWKGRLRLAGMVLILPALFSHLAVKRPDILVSENAALAAFHDGEHLYLSTRTKEKFTGEIWSHIYAQDWSKTQSWRDAKETNRYVSCDSEGCYLRLQNRNIAFSFSPYSHARDCRWADILVARDPVRQKNCNARVVVDRFDVWRHGAHAIYLQNDSEDEVKLRTVADDGRNRPWSEMQNAN